MKNSILRNFSADAVFVSFPKSNPAKISKILDFATGSCYNSKRKPPIIESLRFMIPFCLFFFIQKRYNKDIPQKEG
jgi:hypothetical protein